MIDIAQFVQQIKLGVPTLNNRVYDLAQFMRDISGWDKLPACYVYPLADDTGNAYDVLPGRQAVMLTLAVLVVVRPSGTTDQSYAALNTLRAEIRASLAGWIPDGCYDDVRFAGGQAEEIIEGDLIWEDRYVTRYLLTE